MPIISSSKILASSLCLKRASCLAVKKEVLGYQLFKIHTWAGPFFNQYKCDMQCKNMENASWGECRNRWFSCYCFLQNNTTN
ncbi:hypothetical protein ACB092_04G089200 [Castanea dentata]